MQVEHASWGDHVSDWLLFLCGWLSWSHAAMPSYLAQDVCPIVCPEGSNFKDLNMGLNCSIVQAPKAQRLKEGG